MNEYENSNNIKSPDIFVLTSIIIQKNLNCMRQNIIIILNLMVFQSLKVQSLEVMNFIHKMLTATQTQTIFNKVYW